MSTKPGNSSAPNRSRCATRTRSPATRADQRRLRYGLDVGTLEKVADHALSIDSFPDAKAQIKIWRLPERCEQPRSDPTRPCGILIKGRRAIYENTLFAFENNPHAGWFVGRLECQFIDDLANDYDDRHERGHEHPTCNPIPIISRRREGLAPEHPFVKALVSAVHPILDELVQKEEEHERSEAGTVETEETRRSLSKMAREASRFLQEAMREIEAEEPLVGRDGDVEACKSRRQKWSCGWERSAP